MFGGTLLMILGPCFSQTHSVSLVMPEAKDEVHCKWFSEYSVSCIFPPLYRTGREMVQLRVILPDNQTVKISSEKTLESITESI
jgi:hypothetical protein